MKFLNYYVLPILIASQFQIYSESYIDVSDSISFFKLSQAAEALGMKQLLVNQTTTDYARTIIAEAQQLPSFALILKDPHNDEYWFEFQDDLIRLKTKHEALYRNKGIVRQIKSVFSTRSRNKQEEFKDALTFQEILTKVDMNFFILRTTMLIHQTTKQYNDVNN